MQTAVQCSLDRVRHEDLHLALAKILDVVIEGPEFELLPLGRTQRLVISLESQEIVAPQLLRPFLNRDLGRRLFEVLGSLLVAGLHQHGRARRRRYVLLEPFPDLEQLRQGLQGEQERRVRAARRVQDLREVAVAERSEFIHHDREEGLVPPLPLGLRLVPLANHQLQDSEAASFQGRGPGRCSC